MSVDCKLSARKELALAILPIPSAMLSVVGSVTIIYMAYNNRRKRKCSPYTRLLVAMSVCDIILSSNLSMATFGRPHATSSRVYSFGNSATCSTVGFLNQATTATIFYQSMLSCYFVLTARFGVSNDYIAKKIEPWMHLVSIGYPLATAIITLSLGAYDESSTMLGCWLGTWPKECQESWGETACASMIMGYLWYGIPVILAFTILIANNFVMFSFVRRQMPREKSKRPRLNGSTVQRQEATGFETATEVDDADSSLASGEEQPAPQQPAQRQPCGQSSTGRDCHVDQRLYQQRRVRLVSSQALLFVSSFFLCNAWTTAGAKFESIGTEETEMKILVQFYPVFACQAFFAPLQGFLSMLVYIRPRYLAIRQQHPHQPRRWVVRRAIFGEERKKQLARLQEGVIEEPMEGARVDEQVPPGEQELTRLPYGRTESSLTNSDGDFDHIVVASASSGDRWKGFSEDKTQMSAISTRFHSKARVSTLEVISEYEEITFCSQEEKALHISKEPNILSSDMRWSSNGKSTDSLSTLCPQRVESELKSTVEDSTSITDWTDDTSKDVPIRIPKRRLSPTPTSTVDDF
ncbi:unnamed protein product [Cylindrotheca closterium]|uniref:G-protein coupled receptors family 2 profile 2 domain-containing protein n=1 Tax=Cylindrotheca closterium TaxID=2856 RepID=A0AAD2FK26_9STRA|nr:unnamed protein product [Cylindrotheca closterium]